jgi:type IV pilus assembly protein PilA
MNKRGKMEMKKYLQKKLQNEKGMTLIELLAVIVIIAIIAAIAIPAIANIIENSRFGAAKSDFQNALASASLYIAEEGGDPATVGALVPSYLEDPGTVDTTAAFGRDTSDVLTVEGDFVVSGVTYTLPATTNASLSGMSSEEFKDATAPTTTP